MPPKVVKHAVPTQIPGEQSNYGFILLPSCTSGELKMDGLSGLDGRRPATTTRVGRSLLVAALVLCKLATWR